MQIEKKHFAIRYTAQRMEFSKMNLGEFEEFLFDGLRLDEEHFESLRLLQVKCLVPLYRTKAPLMLLELMEKEITLVNDNLSNMLKQYPLVTAQDKENALKEIIQNIALLGLQSGNFFKKAAFYGGTALRICHGLDRFRRIYIFAYFHLTQISLLNRIFPESIRRWRITDLMPN